MYIYILKGTIFICTRKNVMKWLWIWATTSCLIYRSTYSLNKHWKPDIGFHLDIEFSSTVGCLLTEKWLATLYRIWGAQYAMITYYPNNTSERNLDVVNLYCTNVVRKRLKTCRCKISKLIRTSPEKSTVSSCSGVSLFHYWDLLHSPSNICKLRSLFNFSETHHLN